MIYRFSGFVLDTEQRELRKAGEVVAIPPKPFLVLEYLIERHHRMVQKSELLDAFWTVDVSEAALQTTIRVVRKSLGKEIGAAAIKTYHRQGFRFVAPLSEEATTPEPGHDQLSLREQRLATVLSVQIRAVADDDAVLRAALEVARARIEADHGHLMHMMIDGFTAVFGLGPDSEDSARRAVTCAWDLMASDAVAALGHGVVCGIETGPVIITGDPVVDDWTLPGDIERHAADLARRASSGTIVLGEATRRQLRDEIEVESTAHGHVLRAEPAGRAGIMARASGRRSGFVGRDAELAFLAMGVEKARSGTGQAVLLSGSAGIGKTRLVREFLAQIGAGPPTAETVQCLPRLANTPLGPIRQICRAVSPRRQDLSDLDQVDRALHARLMDETAGPAPVLEGMSELAIRDRSRALFVRMIGARCAQGLLVLVVEDAHWIDPASRAHLSRLIRDADGLRLLLIITSRPTDDVPLAERVLHLSPLGRGDCLALLASLTDTIGARGIAAETLVERAAGNPFFLEELALASRSGADPAQDLPETVQAVMESRVAGQEPSCRGLLYAIAIIGPPAATDLIVRLLGKDRGAVRSDIDYLVRSGFLIEGDAGVMFRHMLLHDTAYAMISQQDKAHLHAEVARLFEAAPEATLPETLAWHWQEAGETDRAIGYWTKASNGALHRFSGQAAITFARHGLALVDPNCPESAQQEMRLQLSLATALMAQSGYSATEVGRAYHRAHELSTQTNSVKARLRALLGLWVHTWVAGRLHESLSHARALLELAEHADDAVARLQGHGSIGAVLMHTGDLNGARAYLEAGMDLIGEAAPDTITVQNAVVNCAAYAAWVAALQGSEQAMRSHMARCEAAAQAIDNPFSQAIHLSLCAAVFMSIGEVEACQDLAERAVTLSRAQRYPFWLGTSLVLRGWALGRRGDPEGGLDAIEEGISVFDTTAAGVQRANWFGIKAEILLAADRPTAGLEAVSVALTSARTTGDNWFVPRIHAVAAELHKRCGDSAAAAENAVKAVGLVETNGMIPAFLNIRGA